MPIKLVNLNGIEFSFNNFLNPIYLYSSGLDKSGSPAQIEVKISAELQVSVQEYQNIGVFGRSIQGIDLSFSMNNVDWFDELTPGASDDPANGVIGNVPEGQNVTKPVWIKATADNAGIIVPGLYELEVTVRATTGINIVAMPKFGIVQ